MHVFRYLVLWAGLIAMAALAMPLDKSSLAETADNAVAVTSVSSRPFIWADLGDSWAVSIAFFAYMYTDS